MPRKRKKILRSAVKLGPVGDLPEETILQVWVKEPLRSWLQANYGRRPERMLSSSFQREVSAKLMAATTIIMNNQTPLDRGNLVRALIQSTKDSNRDYIGANHKYMFKIYTKGIGYALPVTQMPTSWVQHFHRDGKNDPWAKKGWFDRIKLLSRNRALHLAQEWVKHDVPPILKLLKERAEFNGIEVLNSATPLGEWANQSIGIVTR